MSPSTGGVKTGRLAAIAAVVLLALGLATCLPLPRYRSVEPHRSDYAAQELARSMDPWLLGDGLADRVEIEVDWVEGCKPGPLTLQGLHDVVVKYGPPGRPVEIREDETIPRAEWDAASGDRSEAAARTLGQAHANPFVPAGTEHRYVLFAPGRRDGLNGVSISWPVERDGKAEWARSVVVFRAGHARYAKLWISLDKLERMTLVHEFGHQFGLVSNPHHERSDPAHRHHCTRLDCAMAHPTPRVIARNLVRGLFGVFFTDYCVECQRDLRAARDEFRRARAADPRWLDEQRTQRAAARAALPLRPLWEAERWDDLLAESERLLRSFPDRSDLLWHRRQALLGLGRLDEALADYRERAARSDDRSSLAEEARTLSSELSAAGRFAEALDLLGPYRGEEIGDYPYEQVTFVLTTILSELGRPSEAADRVVALLSRGHSISFVPDRMEQRAIALLVRAGRFAEADARLAPLMKGSRRANALGAAWHLRHAEGREDEAHALAEEALASARDAAARAPDLESRRVALHAQAAALAFLGRQDEARRAIDMMVTDDSPLDPRHWSYHLWITGLVLTSRFEEAVEAMGRLSCDQARSWGICSNEDLAPLRAYAPAAAIFARCPAPP